MYSRKSIRPRLEPSGTPALTVNSCEDFHPESAETVYH